MTAALEFVSKNIESIDWNKLSTFIINNKHMPFIDNIFGMAGIYAYWKRRFSNDVLTELDQGIRYCGLICGSHPFNNEVDCNCPDDVFIPCGNCYSYGYCTEQNENHTRWGPVSFEYIKRMNGHTGLRNCPYVPKETFLFVYQEKHYDSYVLTFPYIKNEIPSLLALARSEYIKKHGSAYDDEADDMWTIQYRRKTDLWWWR